MHILFLTDNFPPEVNAPASRTFEHAREWVKCGHHVTVVTCAPNFPNGKVFDGYKNSLWSCEWMEGIKVVRVWTYIAPNQRFFKRVLDYLSFMIFSTFASFFVKEVDVVVGTSPQFFTVCAAHVVALMKRVPWVFELRDIWPESIREVGVMAGESLAFRSLEKLELWLYAKANRVVSVTYSFKENLVKRGVDPDKIDVVTNGVDIARFTPREKDQELVRRYGLEGKFVAGYIGTHGMAHALETVLESAQTMQDGPNGDKFLFLFLGDGARKADLLKLAAAKNLKNVLFIETVSKEMVARYWSLLDVSIIHLRKVDLFSTVIPSKLFECMGMGIPVLHGVSGESARIVLETGCGIPFEPESSSDLVEKLLYIESDSVVYQKCRSNALLSAPMYGRKELAIKMLQSLIGAASRDCVAGRRDGGVSKISQGFRR